MKRSRVSGLIALSIAALSACSPETVLCPAVVTRSVEVEVRDAFSGAPAAAGAIGVATEGLFRDSLILTGWAGPPSDATALVLGGGPHRPGTYQVYIEKPNYLPWVETAVVHSEGSCGGPTTRLQANLSRATE